MPPAAFTCSGVLGREVGPHQPDEQPDRTRATAADELQPLAEPIGLARRRCVRFSIRNSTSVLATMAIAPIIMAPNMPGAEPHGAGVGANDERQHDDRGGDQQADEQLPLLAGPCRPCRGPSS